MIQVLSMTIVAALAGTFIRWGVAGSLWGLLLVNGLGSLAAGLIAGAGRLDSSWSVAMLVGFCGCLTTFSGFAVVMVRLFEQGDFFKLSLHFILNNAMCLSLCYAGWQFTQKYVH